MTELTQMATQDFAVVILMEGRRDNFGYLQKNKEKPNQPPATRSPINIDGIFHYSFELHGYVVDKRNGDRVISKEEFCATRQGKQIFNGVEKGKNATELDAVLQILEIKLSRTDSGSSQMHN